jgi:hypothetical protein
MVSIELAHNSPPARATDASSPIPTSSRSA